MGVKYYWHNATRNIWNHDDLQSFVKECRVGDVVKFTTSTGNGTIEDLGTDKPDQYSRHGYNKDRFNEVFKTQHAKNFYECYELTTEQLEEIFSCLESATDYIMGLSSGEQVNLPKNFMYKWIKIYSAYEEEVSWSLERNYSVLGSTGYVYPMQTSQIVKYWKTEKGAKQNLINYLKPFIEDGTIYRR